MAKKSREPTPEEIREANRRHDAEISKDDRKIYSRIKNKFYDKVDADEINRSSLGTGWNNRWQNSYASNSKLAKDAVLKNQINIKKLGKK
jgi:hypothetical protein